MTGEAAGRSTDVDRATDDKAKRRTACQGRPRSTA